MLKKIRKVVFVSLMILPIASGYPAAWAQEKNVKDRAADQALGEKRDLKRELPPGLTKAKAVEARENEKNLAQKGIKKAGNGPSVIAKKTKTGPKKAKNLLTKKQGDNKEKKP